MTYVLSRMTGGSEMISWVLNGRFLGKHVKCLPVALPYGFCIVREVQIFTLHYCKASIGIPAFVMVIADHHSGRGSILCVRSVELQAENPKIFRLIAPRLVLLAMSVPVFRVPGSYWLQFGYPARQALLFRSQSESFCPGSEDPILSDPPHRF